MRADSRQRRASAHSPRLARATAPVWVYQDRPPVEILRSTSSADVMPSKSLAACDARRGAAILVDGCGAAPLREFPSRAATGRSPAVISSTNCFFRTRERAGGAAVRGALEALLLLCSCSFLALLLAERRRGRAVGGLHSGRLQRSLELVSAQLGVLETFAQSGRPGARRI